jgi:agmatine/peptidylarginine deiminase
MMFDERKTDLLCVSPALQSRFPEIFEIILSNCQASKIELHVVQHFNDTSQNIWVRDWLPLQVGRRFIKFKYQYPGFNPQFPMLRVQKTDWSWLPDVKESRINLDGGNCQRDRQYAVMTDYVITRNSSIKPADLITRLEKLLEAEIILIPHDPSDNLSRPEGIGHSDGIVHFVPGTNKIMVDDFSQMKSSRYHRYFDELLGCLRRFEIILMPNALSKTPRMTEKQFRVKYPHADTFNPGYGYYINFLLVKNLLFLPVFDIVEDDQVVEIIRKHFPEQKIVMVPCRDLSMQGGLCNCIAVGYEK